LILTLSTRKVVCTNEPRPVVVLSNNTRNYNMSYAATAPARNQRETVLNALLEGRELSSAQLRNQYRIPGYRNVIRELRNAGYAIYSNRAPSNGQVGRPATTYRLGTPSRAMVSLAYAIFGPSAFGG
jgi:predicted ArsR family transcriptional regulator